MARSRSFHHLVVTVVLLGLGGFSPAAQAAQSRCFGKTPTIVGTGKADRLRGTPRADVIVSKGGSDSVRGGRGNDLICTGGGPDEARGGRGNDRVDLGKGSGEEARGDDGRDLLVLGPGGFKTAAPGEGNDVVRGTRARELVAYPGASQGVSVDLAAGIATGQGRDRLVNIDDVEGSKFDDTLLGTSGPNFLFGFEGNDTIMSRGNTADPTTPQSVLDFTFDLMTGDAGNDSITGGAGLNVIAHDLAPTGVTVDLQAGKATGDGDDTLSGIQVVVGSRFDDIFRGDNGDNQFESEGGTDSVDGRAGSDTVAFLDAESATVDLAAQTASGTYRPFDPATGRPGAPIPATLSLSGIEYAWGSGGDDMISGDDGVNRLFGFLGADRVFGLGGDDHLDGGPDLGPSGANTLDGGAGNDTCIRGTFTNCEVIAVGTPSGATSRFAWRGR